MFAIDGCGHTHFILKTGNVREQMAALPGIQSEDFLIRFWFESFAFGFPLRVVKFLRAIQLLLSLFLLAGLHQRATKLKVTIRD